MAVQPWLLSAYTHPVLLVVVAVVDHHKAQVEALAQVKEVVRLRFGPAVVVEIQLILLLRVHRHLHRLEQRHRGVGMVNVCRENSVTCMHVKTDSV